MEISNLLLLLLLWCNSSDGRQCCDTEFLSLFRYCARTNKSDVLIALLVAINATMLSPSHHDKTTPLVGNQGKF